MPDKEAPRGFRRVVRWQLGGLSVPRGPGTLLTRLLFHPSHRSLPGAARVGHAHLQARRAGRRRLDRHVALVGERPPRRASSARLPGRSWDWTDTRVGRLRSVGRLSRSARRAFGRHFAGLPRLLARRRHVLLVGGRHLLAQRRCGAGIPGGADRLAPCRRRHLHGRRFLPGCRLLLRRVGAPCPAASLGGPADSADVRSSPPPCRCSASFSSTARARRQLTGSSGATAGKSSSCTTSACWSWASRSRTPPLMPPPLPAAAGRLAAAGRPAAAGRSAGARAGVRAGARAARRGRGSGSTKTTRRRRTRLRSRWRSSARGVAEATT